MAGLQPSVNRVAGGARQRRTAASNSASDARKTRGRTRNGRDLAFFSFFEAVYRLFRERNHGMVESLLEVILSGGVFIMNRWPVIVTGALLTSLAVFGARATLPTQPASGAAAKAKQLRKEAHDRAWNSLAELAASLSADSYGILGDRGEITVVAGTLLGVGELEGMVFAEGDILPTGPVWNPTDIPVLLTTHRPEEPWIFDEQVPAQGVMHMGVMRCEPVDVPGSYSTRDEVPPGCPQSATVICVTGYWACCYLTSTGCPRASCYKQGEAPPSPCSSGGEGSSSCTLAVP